MVTVVVIAVLASVALPYYLNSIRKGRRSDAVAALTALQQAQERWRANNQQYTTSLSNLVPSLGASAATMNSASGYYSVSIDASAANTNSTNYLLWAQAIPGTSQAGDTQCTSMQLQLFNGAVVYGSCAGCSTVTAGAQVSDPKGCWAK